MKQDHSIDSPLELERLLNDAVDQALKHEDPVPFLAWIRTHLAEYLSDSQPELFGEDGQDIRLAGVLGRSIWNAMPLPGNGLRPRPLREPGRNEPCFCDSGEKYKRCCARGPALLPLDSELFLPLVLERMPKASVQGELRAGRVPIRSLIELGTRYADGGRPKKGVAVLEPLFDVEIRRPDEIHDHALTVLCNLYDELGFHKKKMSLLQRVLETVDRSPLRAGAWQRLAAIRMDQNDADGAWEALHQAGRDNPDDPGIALLEIQLLVAKNRIAEARGRAAFWEKRLSRSGMDDEDPMLQFLSSAARDPHRTMAEVGISAAGGAGERLAGWLEEVVGRPLPAYRAVGPDDEESGDFDADLTRRLRAMGVPDGEIENAKAVLRQQLETLPAESPEPGEPPEETSEPEETLYLIAPPEIEVVEALWREVCPVIKPFSIQDLSFGDEDAWDPATEAQWVATLDAHPEACDSLDILDDLATIVMEHPHFGTAWVDCVFLGPLLRRAESIIARALDGIAEPRLLWTFPDNRPPLRSIARLVNLYMRHQDAGSAADAAQRMLSLNPPDNHGFRTLVINHRLRHGDDEGALILADNYPDDLVPECAYGKVLALYRLDRLEAARQALCEAMQSLPKVVRYLTAARVRRPKLESGRISYGGDDQAWLYREAMRDVWLETPGAVEWLQRTAKRFR